MFEEGGVCTGPPPTHNGSADLQCRPKGMYHYYTEVKWTREAHVTNIFTVGDEIEIAICEGGGHTVLCMQMKLEKKI